MKIIKLILILLVILPSHILFCQNTIDEVEELLLNSICTCMETEYENNHNVDHNTVMSKCANNIEADIEELFKNLENHVAPDSISKFMGNLPNLISDKILYDCPKVCKRMNREMNWTKLNDICKSQFTNLEVEPSIHLTKACQCLTEEFIDNYCAGQYKDQKREDLTIESLQKCMLNDIENILDIKDKSNSEIIEVYENLIAGQEEFKNINTKEYCNCYFEELYKLEIDEDKMLEFLLYKKKPISKIEKKCKKANVTTTNQEASPLYEYDESYVDYVKHRWDKSIEINLQDPKYQFQESFYETLSHRDESILVDKFLVKPNINNLLVHYLDTKLQWNSFNQGNKKKITKQVIETNLKSLPSENEMLAFYYNTIFIHILNNQRNIQPYDRDIDLNKLNLTNTQKTILFLTAVKKLGRQVYSYSNANFPDNCFRQHELLKKIPKFNGQDFYNFELYEYEDFLIHLDKRYPKQSFKENYEPEFRKAIEGYEKCIGQ